MRQGCATSTSGATGTTTCRCGATSRSPEMIWWRDELRDGPARLVGTLPLSHDLLVSGRHIRLFHASATSPHVRVRAQHTAEEFEGMFANTHDDRWTGRHRPWSATATSTTPSSRWTRGRTLFNVGSVGNPLDEPVPSYAILEGVVDEPGQAPFGLQFIRVPYDIEAEIEAAAGLWECRSWSRMRSSFEQRCIAGSSRTRTDQAGRSRRRRPRAFRWRPGRRRPTAGPGLLAPYTSRAASRTSHTKVSKV